MRIKDIFGQSIEHDRLANVRLFLPPQIKERDFKYLQASKK